MDESSTATSKRPWWLQLYQAPVFWAVAAGVLSLLIERRGLGAGWLFCTLTWLCAVLLREDDGHYSKKYLSKVYWMAGLFGFILLLKSIEAILTQNIYVLASCGITLICAALTIQRFKRILDSSAKA